MKFLNNIFIYILLANFVQLNSISHYDNIFLNSFKPLTINPVAYHLRLQNDNHYVGVSYNLNQDYFLHLNGKSNYWTKKYRPITIEKVWTHSSIELVNQITLNLINTYGKEKVRGGKYINYETIDKLVNDKYKLGDKVFIPREYCPFTEVNSQVVNHLHYIIATVIDTNKYLLTYQYKIEQTLNSSSFYTDRIAIKNIYSYKNRELDEIMKFRKIKWVQELLKKFNFHNNNNNYEIIYINKTWFCKYKNSYLQIKYDKSLSYSGIINAGKCTKELEKIGILNKIYNQDFRIYDEKIESKDIFWQLLLIS